MTTVELIRFLRNPIYDESTQEVLSEAADRLEELDERIAIMEEGCGILGGENEESIKETQL